MPRRPSPATWTFLLISFAAYALGQSMSPTSDAAGAVPESGFVSDSKYTNAFFGFSLLVPQDSGLHELRLSIKGATWGHFLIGLQAQKNGLTTFTITAKQSSGGPSEEAKNAASGPKMQKTKRIEVGGKEFWRGASQDKSKDGKMQNVTFATAINGYVLRFDIISFDAELTIELERSVEALTFFDPAKAKDIAGPDSRAYNPMAPDYANARVIPSGRIPQLNPGSISGNVYRNEELGFRYEFPAGWVVNDKATQEKIVEAGHQFVWGNDPSAAREHEIAQQCTKILLFVSQHPAGTKTDQLNPLVVVMAVDPACSRGAHFPKSIDDREAIQQVTQQLVRSFAGTPFASHDKAQVRAFTTEGHLVIEVSQSFAVNAPAPSRTLEAFTSMILMDAKDYWLAWMFEGGSEAELRELKSTKIFFPRPVPAQAEQP